MPRAITLTPILFLILILNTPAFAQDSPPEEIITKKLNHFLANVSDYQTHDDFWSEDLVYTGSAGVRHGKSTIMQNLSGENAGTDNTVSPYSAADIKVSVYGNTAVLTFTLVNKTEDQISKYFNSGMLVLKDSTWKVVCWQATKVPKI